MTKKFARQSVSFIRNLSNNCVSLFLWEINAVSAFAPRAKDLREAIAYADSVHDYVSRDMMIEILVDEEGHIDWLETELDLIGKIGLQNYLQSQIKVKD
ncbi:Bacterioferritin [Shigella boydii]|uniref:Bacterioferritin n=1 Tax=Shigella dysenteriae TaxID=622 RepID=A0A3P6KZF5_SHIDY|nr:bacterioferritin [Shigella dysenteriae 225-75]VDG86456.1 bacterioferritin [Shigella dysenteriae]